MIHFNEVKVLDINAEYSGVLPEKLMENAGRIVAAAVVDRFGDSKRICVVCGTGNNAGDGLVAARYLAEKNSVYLAFIKGPEKLRTAVARRNFYRAKTLISGFISEQEELRDFDIIIDAMLGIGISGEVREPYLSWIDAVNTSGVPVVSVDIPSGLGTNRAVKPALTVTFHDAKYGMTDKNCGEIIIADIQIPEEAIRYVGPGEFVYYNTPSDNAHKGDSGKVLVIGGGPYTGAPILSSMGAYRTGADLVYIASVENVVRAAADLIPELIGYSLPGKHIDMGHVGRILKLMQNADSVVLGPGMGREPGTIQVVQALIRAALRVPVVIDADGLFALSTMDEFLSGSLRLKGVITPHRGEFVRLHPIKGKSPSEEDVRELARKTGMTVLLKGKEDIISDGERTKLNRTGNPAMTVGGTGDVLAGITGALLARGLSPFDAARLAAFISGSAGDMAFSEKSYGLLASDVVEQIPFILKKYLGDL